MAETDSFLSDMSCPELQALMSDNDDDNNEDNFYGDFGSEYDDTSESEYDDEDDDDSDGTPVYLSDGSHSNLEQTDTTYSTLEALQPVSSDSSASQTNSGSISSYTASDATSTRTSNTTSMLPSSAKTSSGPISMKIRSSSGINGSKSFSVNTQNSSHLHKTRILERRSTVSNLKSAYSIPTAAYISGKKGTKHNFIKSQKLTESNKKMLVRKTEKGTKSTTNSQGVSTTSTINSKSQKSTMNKMREIKYEPERKADKYSSLSQKLKNSLENKVSDKLVKKKASIDNISDGRKPSKVKQQKGDSTNKRGSSSKDTKRKQNASELNIEGTSAVTLSEAVAINANVELEMDSVEITKISECRKTSEHELVDQSSLNVPTTVDKKTDDIVTMEEDIKDSINSISGAMITAAESAASFKSNSQISEKSIKQSAVLSSGGKDSAKTRETVSNSTENISRTTDCSRTSQLSDPFRIPENDKLSDKDAAKDVVFPILENSSHRIGSEVTIPDSIQDQEEATSSLLTSKPPYLHSTRRAIAKYNESLANFVKSRTSTTKRRETPVIPEEQFSGSMQHPLSRRKKAHNSTFSIGEYTPSVDVSLPNAKASESAFESAISQSFVEKLRGDSPVVIGSRENSTTPMQMASKLTTSKKTESSTAMKSINLEFPEHHTKEKSSSIASGKTSRSMKSNSKQSFAVVSKLSASTGKSMDSLDQERENTNFFSRCLPKIEPHVRRSQESLSHTSSWPWLSEKKQDLQRRNTCHRMVAPESTETSLRASKTEVVKPPTAVIEETLVSSDDESLNLTNTAQDLSQLHVKEIDRVATPMSLLSVSPPASEREGSRRSSHRRRKRVSKKHKSSAKSTRSGKPAWAKAPKGGNITTRKDTERKEDSPQTEKSARRVKSAETETEFRPKKALPKNAFIITHRQLDAEIDMTCPKVKQCTYIHEQLIRKGLNQSLQSLVRALLPPKEFASADDLKAASLPSSTTHWLLTHPQEWLSQEYKKVLSADKAYKSALTRHKAQLMVTRSSMVDNDTSAESDTDDGDDDEDDD